MRNASATSNHSIITFFNHYSVWVVCAGLSVWLILLVWNYAVDLLIGEQIRLQIALLESSNPLDHFFHTLARHRQGLAFVIWGFVVRLFGVDARIPAWISLTFMILATLVAVRLIQQIDRPMWTDMLIPITFLSAKLHETLLGGSNPSHGSFPLLMMMGMIASFNIRNLFWKSVTLGVCYFFLIFSGFGFLMIPVAPVFSIIAMIGQVRADGNFDSRLPKYTPHYTVFVATVTGIGLFLWDYHPESALACFEGEILPLQQSAYAFRIVGHVLGFTRVNGVALAAGGLFAFSLIYITLRSAWILAGGEGLENREQQKLASQILLMAGFTLIFVAATAYGRACQGQYSALAGRYLPYVLTGMWAFYAATKAGWFSWFYPSNTRSHMMTVIAIFGVILVFQLMGTVAWLFTAQIWHHNKMAIVTCSEGMWQRIPDCQDQLDIRIFPNSRWLQDLLVQIYGAET